MLHQIQNEEWKGIIIEVPRKHHSLGMHQHLTRKEFHFNNLIYIYEYIYGVQLNTHCALKQTDKQIITKEHPFDTHHHQVAIPAYSRLCKKTKSKRKNNKHDDEGSNLRNL